MTSVTLSFMQTKLAAEFANTQEGQDAEALLRQCVHCGFCTATCPTYQLLGDELDGPRGRIYLIKQMFEGAAVTRATQVHLDRCLTCRNCESTCPSGVQYGALIDLGRTVVERKVERPAKERAIRWALKEGMTSPVFAPALKVGQAVRGLLPAVLRDKVPPRLRGAEADLAQRWPVREHDRKVLLLMGCVQGAMAPNINSATARVLDACGIQCLVADEAGCCGAVRTHLGDHEGGLADMRRNVDAWWPLLHQGKVEALVMNASGCGVMIKDYATALAHDPDYADKARLVSAATHDLGTWMAPVIAQLSARVEGRGRKLAFHPPCTLQHGQQLRGGIEAGLRSLGFDVALASNESHLCCGSAGTYSVLQPSLSKQLRDRKIQHLSPLKAEVIVSANMGCIQHLQSGTTTPVRHWIEVVDAALQDRAPA